MWCSVYSAVACNHFKNVFLFYSKGYIECRKIFSVKVSTSIVPKRVKRVKSTIDKDGTGGAVSNLFCSYKSLAHPTGNVATVGINVGLIQIEI